MPKVGNNHGVVGYGGAEAPQRKVPEEGVRGKKPHVKTEPTKEARVAQAVAPSSLREQRAKAMEARKVAKRPEAGGTTGVTGKQFPVPGQKQKPVKRPRIEAIQKKAEEAVKPKKTSQLRAEFRERRKVALRDKEEVQMGKYLTHLSSSARPQGTDLRRLRANVGAQKPVTSRGAEQAQTEEARQKIIPTLSSKQRTPEPQRLVSSPIFQPVIAVPQEVRIRHTLATLGQIHSPDKTDGPGKPERRRYDTARPEEIRQVLDKIRQKKLELTSRHSIIGGGPLQPESQVKDPKDEIIFHTPEGGARAFLVVPERQVGTPDKIREIKQALKAADVKPEDIDVVILKDEDFHEFHSNVMIAFSGLYMQKQQQQRDDTATYDVAAALAPRVLAQASGAASSKELRRIGGDVHLRKGEKPPVKLAPMAKQEAKARNYKARLLEKRDKRERENRKEVEKEGVKLAERAQEERVKEAEKPVAKGE